MKESVKGIRMTKDERGVVFDLPSDLASVVKVCGGLSSEAMHSVVLSRKVILWEVSSAWREQRRFDIGILIQILLV